VTLTPAIWPADLTEVRALFTEYADWLAQDHGIDLAHGQALDQELAELPGSYAPPAGQLILARGDEATPGGGPTRGVIAFRPGPAPDTCEIKRLYVRPAARGTGLARRLIAEILDQARAAGYAHAVLDTAGFMAGAQALYEAAGFRDIPPYWPNPISHVPIRYMGVALQEPAVTGTTRSMNTDRGSSA
jgi:ribosomal protein S18 acetylase RimI-like enzyme